MLTRKSAPPGEIGVLQAKTNLSALLRRAARGERIVITRHGRPLAELGPPAGGSAAAEAMARIDRRSARHKLGGLDPRALVGRGRRF
jgi:prevent-host-death family protein